jgi:hypothetical protein
MSQQICDYIDQAITALQMIRSALGCSSGGNGSVPNRQKFRPQIPAGASMIAQHSTACTFTAWVIDKATQKLRMIVANHCGMENLSANCNPVPAGTPWVQPSPMDGGTDNDHVAKRGSEKPDITDPYVDAIILDPDDQSEFTNAIVGQGTIDGKASDVQNGEQIYLSGRTSGPQEGVVVYPSTDVNIDYGACGILTKRDCIMAQITIAGGDSGDPATVVRNGKRLIVGMWNAGSSMYGVAMKIPYVEAKYNCDFDISHAQPQPPQPPNPPPNPTAALSVSVDGGQAITGSKAEITASLKS